VIHVVNYPKFGAYSLAGALLWELDFREHFDGDVCDFALLPGRFYARTTKGETVCIEGET